MPKIVITTKQNKVLCDEFEVADTFLKKTIGLMFAKKPKNILFKFCEEDFNGIHSFFVPFDFDAVFLSTEKRVVSVHHSIKPFVPIIMPKRPAKYLVETSAGLAKQSGVEEGDVVFWNE